MLRKILLAAALASLAWPAFAGADNPFLARMMGRPLAQTGKYFACFSRTYDDAHLAKHPEQRVAFTKAMIKAWPEKEAGKIAYAWQVSLAFKFRDRPETLTSVAECGKGETKDHGGVHCAGPGDAGMRLALAGRKGITMTIPGGADLWAPGPIDQRHDTIKNPFGPDDVTFRLVRTDLKQCEDLAFDYEKPLRPFEPSAPRM